MRLKVVASRQRKHLIALYCEEMSCGFGLINTAAVVYVQRFVKAGGPFQQHQRCALYLMANRFFLACMLTCTDIAEFTLAPDVAIS